jgi:alpha/beta superfamily hydrolase
MMDSHLFRKAAWRLPALAGLAVLRFNTRGTTSVRGTSGGEFDHGQAERFDVAAAIEYIEFAGLPAPWLVGWSFGTDLALMHGCDPAVAGAVLISPPLRYSGPEALETWASSGKPMVALVPEFDDYLRPEVARQRFAAVPQAEVVPMLGARHLLVGYADEVLDEIVSRIVPGVVPLPRSWDGPMEAGDSSAYADRTLAAFADTPRPVPPVPPRSAEPSSEDDGGHLR